ncbi:hypothetical protein I3843_04G029200 [Carya illinoinensis]|uniref:Uncharacterized protein n=1 Tax=Carya illinoinensis TaxID=32201 RepID=A0A8T1QQN6_CARIL|nr:hypothetical protein CIPAW_04G030100 [Carya illinoinensis]KAG6716084.1 hypothetical protein I3842_04G030200 [Carya illinoinensis]KAG7982029.1 hypothetical protein I3843_04G029200 [Carya illinoinensis]
MAMSLTELTSVFKFPYQRLGNEGGFEDYEERERVVLRSRAWCRFKRVSIRRRFKLKVPNLRKFLRKARLLPAVRVSCSWARALKRLKESQAHFGDIFAGNYLFIQVNPTSLTSLKRDRDVYGLSSRYSLPRVA